MHAQCWCNYRVEQAYIDAYEGEGWKGANREKLKPDGDLKQAHLRVKRHLDLQFVTHLGGPAVLGMHVDRWEAALLL